MPVLILPVRGGGKKRGGRKASSDQIENFDPVVRILANGLCKPSSVSEPISAQHCFLQGMECQNYVGKRQLNKINYLRTSKKCERFLDLKAARLLILKYSVRAG